MKALKFIVIIIIIVLLMLIATRVSHKNNIIMNLKFNPITDPNG